MERRLQVFLLSAERLTNYVKWRYAYRSIRPLATNGMWLGYFEEFPDYLTQGQSPQELEENLRDLYRDLTCGEIPGIRRVSELSVG
jgi:hypothetical protein